MILFLKLLHVFSVCALIALSGVCCAVILAPEAREYKRKLLFWSGMASLAVFLTGFAVLGMLKYGMPGWAMMKVVCWVILSAAGGVLFRRPEKWRLITSVGGAAVFVALLMVFFRPGL